MNAIDVHAVPVIEKGDSPRLSRAAAWFTLAALTLVLFVSYVDRFILAILVQPIKAEFKLNDSEVGLLTGLAFSASLAICGIPFARWADRGSRKIVIGCSLIAWSVLTAVCGVAQNFIQLLSARLSVGAAESGNLPAAQAMIADMFPPGFRSTAIGIFNAGASAGMMLGFPIGAWLEFHMGWRGALISVGVPGVVLGLLFMALVPEPPRRHDTAVLADAPTTVRESWTDATRALWRIPAFRQILLAHTASIFLDYGQTNWMAAYFERSFGVSRLELSSFLASTKGIGMICGTLLGGFLADRLAKKGLRGPTTVILFARSLLIFPTVAIYLAPTSAVAYAAAAIAGFTAMLSVAPDISILMTIIPASRRATAGAITMLASSIVGMGCGPLLVGMMSDALAPHFGVQSLRIALFSLSLVATLWCLCHYIMMAYHLRQDEKVTPLTADMPESAI